MFNKNRLVLSLLLPMLAIGCAAGDVRPYKDVLKDWTAKEKVRKGIDLILTVRATYKSKDFIEAFNRRYADVFELADAEKSGLKERSEKESLEFNEFFVVTDTSEESWNDFERKGSIWRFYLEDDKGLRLSPLKIKMIESDNESFKEFYPYIGPWSKAYIVKFPKYAAEGGEAIPSETSTYIKLVITGPKGKGELVWNMN